MNNRIMHTSSSLALLALLASLTACGGSSSSNTSNNNDTGGTPATPTTPTESGVQATPPQTGSTVIGEVLVSANNLTLYTFDNDTQNDVSTCTGTCADTWPPLLASSTATAVAPYTIFSRADGSRQWSFKGDPLYRFQGDAQSGDVNGENIGGTWHVSRPDPVVVSEIALRAQGQVSTPAGRVEKDNFTLYTFANDTAGASSCNDSCAQTWPPLLADAGAKAEQPFNIIERDDQTRQWAFNDKPLYLFSGDTTATDATGEGVGGVWFSARVAPLTVIDAGSEGQVLAVRGPISDGAGNVMTEKEGFVVYTFDEDSTDTSTCFDACAETWPPLYAQASDVAFGDYSVIDRNENGVVKQQWALGGEPLYFFVGDQAPGDTNGVYGTWHAAKP